MRRAAPQTREEARNIIVETAREMIAGRLRFIEGAPIISSCRVTAGIADFDEDFIPFTEIISETDALPLGEERELWSAAALEKLQPEIERAELWARCFAEASCMKLIKRFSSP